jgi:putative component of membrane protein insertase Oxa1/YidC/SpoIIIJ protein YidD
MKAPALLAIRLYQRLISPYKGFTCAYRARTGRAGCSGLGYRAIRRHGAWRGWLILRRRLEKCGQAHRTLHAQHSYRKAQAGFCDCADALSCGDLLSGADTASDVASCACDLNSLLRRHNNPDEEKQASTGWVIFALVVLIAFIGFVILLTRNS